MQDSKNIKVALVGNPNVGKSVFFGRLTKKYIDVSNYPGTTVEISRGEVEINGRQIELIDTPGVNSLIPVSEEERITRDLLFSEKPDIVIQVADAKNVQRSLMLTSQLAEANFPTLLALNMADEADKQGIDLDTDRLSQLIGTEAVLTVAPTGKGFGELKELLFDAKIPDLEVEYSQPLRNSVEKIRPLLSDSALPTRATSLMLLSGDEQLLDRVKKDISPGQAEEIKREREKLSANFSQPVSFNITRRRKKLAGKISQRIKSFEGENETTISEIISNLTTRPLSGLPIFLLILYGVYQFVGVLGAQVMVDFLETNVFGGVINPFVRKTSQSLFGSGFITDMFVGPYGLVTMGLAWAVAIVLPVVSTFFLAFSFLEDSGYIPRLSVMVDRLFRKIGLNGKAVLPMVLGLGCDTMATMTTRTLETEKERRIATLLLALGVPCSAQLGVIMGLFGYASHFGLMVWGGVVASQLLLIGWLSSKVFKGKSSEFIMEMPPIRLPRPLNVLKKTYTRVKWFFKEVLPFFLIGTLVVFLASKSGILARLIEGFKPFVSGLLDLPEDTAVAFILGFVRRDYGTAGLFEMARQARLTPLQITVSSVVITLFVPCIANYLMIIKERGLKVALAIVSFIIPYALLVGTLLNLTLRGLGVYL